MGALIMIIFIILGIFIAIITWKAYPNFLSRRDYYRNSPYEIFKLRGVTTLSAFIVTCVIGFGIKDTIEKDKKEVSKDDIETVTPNEIVKKKKNHKRNAEFTSTDAINENIPNNNVSQSEDNTETGIAEISTDSTLNN